MEQDLQEALGVFRRGAELANTDVDRVMTAVALSEALVFGTGDFVGASTVLERVMDTVTDPTHRATVASSLALSRGLTGDLGAALSYGDELLDSPDIEPVTRLKLAVMWTLAAAANGRFEPLQQRLDDALVLALELRARVPGARDQLLATQVLFDVADGRLPEALRLATEQRREAERNHWSTAIWDQCLAEAELLAGRGASATKHITQAVACDSTSDLIGIRSLGLAKQAAVAACVGDFSTARRALDLSIADPRCGPREQASLGRARANVLALEGDLDRAVDLSATSLPTCLGINSVERDRISIYPYLAGSDRLSCRRTHICD